MHTPGSWLYVVEQKPTYKGWPVSHWHTIETPEGVIISEVYTDGSDVEDNARLIAAAPDLLKALKNALDTAEFDDGPFRGWHEQARAAIAKATGE